MSALSLRAMLADGLVALAVRLYPEARFLDPEDDGERLDPSKWAAFVILHAEAVHGCEHTDQPRRELEMVGPRGRPAS